MNKLNLSISYSSGTSSETSETQGVEENQQSDIVTLSCTNTPPIPNSGNKIPKSWKQMKDSGQDKDAESKRPPWQAVSISTLPKPDKNAILRAKLLDASRRLRASKTAVGVQTDIVPIKLMKEVSLGAQTDLILFKEVGILTDGSYAKRREGAEEYILTYSVPLMTNTIETSSVGTQTLIPRLSGDGFLEACVTSIGPYDSKLLQQCTDSKKKLLKQWPKIRKNIITPPTAKFEEETEAERTENESPTDTNTVKTNYSVQALSSDFPLASNSSTLPCIPYRFSLLNPTHLSWYFEYDHEFSCANKFHPYTITANKPWNSFVPQKLGAKCSSDLSFFLIAIDELIQESNRLVDRIDEMSKNREQGAKFLRCRVKEKEPVPTIFKPTSEYWLPIIEEQERVLAELKSLKSTDIKNFQKYNGKLE